jgi:hypothetical protein
MPATQQDLMDAQLRLLDADTEASRGLVFRVVSELAVAIMNDKHTSTSRTPENIQKAVDEAVAIYKAVSVAMRKPDLYGPAS